MLTNSEIEIVCCATADDAIAMNNAAIMIRNVFIFIHWYFIIKQPDSKEPFMFLGEWEYDVIKGCLRLIV